MPAIVSSHSSEQPLSAELLGKAKLLKKTSLFVNPSDGAGLFEKQMIFLVLAGYKSVATALSGHWVDIPGGRRTVADDPQTVRTFLQSLGLAFSLSDFDGHATVAVVALKQELIDEYARGSDHSTFGRLYGYPETAVSAFTLGGQALLDDKEQQQRENEAELPDGLTNFRLSRNHWADELEVVRQWCVVLRTADLLKA